jgi:DNA transformation protein
MATSRSTTEFILDQLSAVPNVRVRKMFGEYALYCDEKVVALICDDQLFVKITRSAGHPGPPREAGPHRWGASRPPSSGSTCGGQSAG